jgi:hypothetical protein
MIEHIKISPGVQRPQYLKDHHRSTKPHYISTSPYSVRAEAFISAKDLYGITLSGCLKA